MKASAAAAAFACLAALGAHAFKLHLFGGPSQEALSGAKDRQAAGFLMQFTSDVHERMTRQAYIAAGVKLPDDVIAGVRWNDNPPALRMAALFGACGMPGEGMHCWASMLRLDRHALEAVSRREKSIAGWRSHFGDMQFLHAMAASAGEPAAETRDKALRWAEFAYAVARGAIEPGAKVHQLGRGRSALDAATADWMAGLFAGAEKQLWTVRDLFAPAGGDLERVAFGSLLHLVQDSYSAAHVRRSSARVQLNGCASYDASDAIVGFHTYLGQGTQKHGLCDDVPDWLDSPRPGSPVEVMAELVRAYHAGAEWSVVKALLEGRVFRLADGAAAASTGRCFETGPEASHPESALPPATALDPACRDAIR